VQTVESRLFISSLSSIGPGNKAGHEDNPQDRVSTGKLLSLCLKTMYFVYEDVYYQQSDGAVMGSPVANLLLLTCCR